MLFVQNGNVIDPIRGTIEKRDIFIQNGMISDKPAEKAEIVDAAGLYISPGLVDIHVHFRQPGFEYKEDLLSGAKAAAAGGITSAACMANTNPVIDSPEWVRYIKEKAADAVIGIYPIAAVTIGQAGERLTDFGALKEAGACALSDDGMPVSNAQLMLEALRKAEENGLIIIAHSEDFNMTDGRSVNEGAVSKKLGVKGRPCVAEEYMIARDAMLAKYAKAKIHIAHVSTSGSVDIIRDCKASGIDISCETCPQYFMLTEDEVIGKGAEAKMFPPLRAQKDVEGIIKGLTDGTIDIIATDHAPHAENEKRKGLLDAPGGMVGLETSLAAALTALYHTKRMNLTDIIRKMTVNPAARFGLHAGGVNIGDRADLVIFDAHEVWTVKPEKFLSKSKNTPFAGMTLNGRVKYTIYGGNIVYRFDRIR